MMDNNSGLSNEELLKKCQKSEPIKTQDISEILRQISGENNINCLNKNRKSNNAFLEYTTINRH